MAIVINYNPPTYSGLHNDLLFTVYESVKANDPVTYPNYKYVCDVYVGGVMIFRAKAFPRPDNKRGVFNLSSILRSYVATQLNPLAATSGILAQQFGSTEFYLDVQCKFGEEYNFVTYTNLTLDSTRRYYNHYNNQVYSSPTILNNYVDNIASNRPYANAVRYSMLNYFVPYFSVNGTLVVSVIAYNANSAHILTTDSDFILIEGRRLAIAGAPAYTSVTGSVTFAPTAGSLQQLNLCPAAINASITGIIDPDLTVFYIVTINSSISYLFVLTDEAIFTPYTLHFLNQIGGFDSRDFTKKSSKTYEVDRKTYVQQPFRIDASGGVAWSTSHNVVNEIGTTYSSQFKKKMKLATDLLADGDWAWLKELLFSPNVYLQDGSYMVPVTITDTNYEEIKFVNERAMKPLVVEIDFNTQLNAQFR